MFSLNWSLLIAGGGEGRGAEKVEGEGRELDYFCFATVKLT